jgi:NAD(P)H-hydrate epimerase
MTTNLSARNIRSLIPPRRKDSNKGDYGHVLVLAGSRGMLGAARLCTHAALRAGAGLVTLGIPDSQYAAVAGSLRPEAMTLSLPAVARDAFSTITAFIRQRKITSVVAGPGLGAGEGTYRLVQGLLKEITVPFVLDADGINALTRESGKKGLEIPSLRRSGTDVIITPHPGEFSRLTGLSVKEIQQDRVAAAKAFAQANDIICVLKGYRTVITDGKDVFVNPTGNPGMATGGTGDALSGIVAGLLAQSVPGFEAACAGVWFHAEAGCAVGPGLIADDLPDALPKVLKTYFAEAGT